MSRRVLLEICVASVDDALTAVEGGADRLELNAALALGGLTPSAGLMVEVRIRVRVPVIAMVRPRAGGFCYSDSDVAVMQRDVEGHLAAGAAGTAFGILKANGEIDRPRCRQLREVCGDKEAVFHRAFDLTPDPFAALAELIDLGFTRVLTSGQASTAFEGRDLIAELIHRATGRIELLPAAGIHRRNVAALVIRTGCNQVHASARVSARDESEGARPKVRFVTAQRPVAGSFERTDGAAVAGLQSALKEAIG